MADVRSLPKVVLHDHLDGGLRPGTVADLAEEMGYDALPVKGEAALADWFDQSGAPSLEKYLEAFQHTFGVMQTPEALRRVAFEAVADHAAHTVVYAEIRFAPSLHTARGMSRAEVIEAVLDGLAIGTEQYGVPVGLIVDAMRQDDDSEEVAEVAGRFAGSGVVAFDLAGPERGFPAPLHAAACEIARDAGLHLTIHAGEGDGVASRARPRAVGAARLGPRVRIVEDLTVENGVVTAVGPVAEQVLHRHIPLEVCPSSNLDTGMYPTPAAHPLGVLHRAGFPVTLNTDNRLMSRISMTDEFAFAVEHHGFTHDDLRAVTLRAVEVAFCVPEVRDRARERVERGYL
jgi:adenosine deaminase